MAYSWGKAPLFIRANYGQWFPSLLERSQFNRRLRRLEPKLESLRRKWVEQLGGLDADSFIIDTKPIPVVGYRRSKRHSDFHGSADYGYCAAGNRIWTIQRSNQHQQVSSDFKRLIGRVRQRIEGVFHEIQNTGRNPERLLNKTVNGLATHMAAKIASHTLRLLLRRQFGIDVLTFQSVSTY
jgi:hypothetical protein